MKLKIEERGKLNDFLKVIIIIILNLIIATNFTYSQSLTEPQNTIEELEIIEQNIDLAQNKILDNKITEMRNILWENVDPKIKLIVDELENDIETIKYIGIYNYEQLNLSPGDIKRGMDMFERTKIDSTYAINEMDFEKKIKDLRDVTNELKKIAILMPEAEVTYQKINQPYNFTKEDVDKFSIEVKDVSMYTRLSYNNYTLINQITDVIENEIYYSFTNKDEDGMKTVITSVNKKIVAKENIKYVEVYEIFRDAVNISEIIFKSPHSVNNSDNFALVYQGSLLKDSIIPINYIAIINESQRTSQTLIYFNSEHEVKKEEIIISKPKENKPAFDDVEIYEKYNIIPYIILGLLVSTFIVILVGSMVSKNETAKELENFRKKINNLKKQN